MNNYQDVTHEFGPVYDHKTKILILGSFPSVQSRKQQFYYMNPLNRFYKVLSNLFNEDFVNCEIDEKIQLLKKHHIGLYDVVESCSIINSSDQDIKDIEVINLKPILENSEIEKIFLNGTKAYEIFKKNFPQYLSIASVLPSTSPRNARYTIEKLTEVWEKILY